MRALVLAATLAASSAIAAPTFHVGPSVSLSEVRPGALNPVQLTPGLGMQGWVDFGKGANWSADLAVFGAPLGLGTAHAGAGVSVAPFICYAPYGACLGPLVDLFGSTGGLYKLPSGPGFTWKQNVGVVFSLKAPIFDLLHFKTGAQ